MAEKLITLRAKGGLANFRRALSHARRQVHRPRSCSRRSRPQYKDRPGGYTRILRLSGSENRLGDNAPQVIMELARHGQACGS